MEPPEPESPSPARATQYWVTYLLIAANLVAFALEIAAGADAIKPTPQKMIELGGDFAPLTLHGEWWRLVSSMFLHYGVIHIGLNMVCLAQGRVVEKLFGHAGFAALYLVSGLLGGALSMARNTNVVSAGASGAVFGVYGAFFAFTMFRRAQMGDTAWQKTTRQIGTFVAINLIYGFSTPGIDMSAHIGGLIGGFAVGAGLLIGQRAEAQRAGRAIGLSLAGIAVTVGALVALRAPTDVTPVLEEFDRVQAASIATWNTLLEGAKSGGLSDAQFADKLEPEVIAPWRALRAKVDAVDKPPARLVPLWNLMKSYLAARQTAWETFAIAARTTGEAQAAKLEIYKRDEATAKERFDAFQLEIGRLKE